MSEMMVSICMITYNHQPFIREAIEGVLMQQTTFPFELVIGEDCSTDRTRDICIEYKQKHPDKIRLLLNEKNLGMMPNFIQTLNACSGKYIALCEGDDYWTDPMKLQKQVEFLEGNEEYAGAFHDVDVVDRNGEFLHKIPQNLLQIEFKFEDVVQGWFVPTASFFFRNSLIHEEIKKFDNVISGDRLLLALIASKGKIKYFKETLGVYRKHPGGISIYGNRIIIFKSNVQLFKQLNKFFKPKYKRVLVNQIFRWSGILTNEYYKNGKMLLFIKQLFITVLYIRSFIDFKTYIKNFLLQK